MKNKKRMVKCLAVLLLIFNVFIIVLNLYSYIPKRELSDKVRASLSEIAYQNKMIVENNILQHKKTIKELAIVLSSKDTLINNSVLEIIKKMYEINDYKNIGIITPEKTIYMSFNGEFITLEKDFFKYLDDKEDLIILDNDIVDNQYSIFIREQVISNKGEKGYLFFSYDLIPLLSKLSISTFNGKGYTYIIDGNGNIILNCSNKNNISNFINIFDEMLKTDKNNLNVVNILKKKIKNNEEGLINFLDGINKEMY